MLRVGLTGGIASGKSHVAETLAQAGCRRLDLDRIGHEVIAPGGAAHADVVSAFGEGVVAPDGSIDRKALGAIVFADPRARARLNAIVHPRIRAEEARLTAALPSGGVLVVEAALLVETGQHLRFDRLVVAHCGEQEQQRRLMKRDGLVAEAAAARLAAQMPPDLKRAFAHEVVDTAGSLSETRRAAAELARRLLGLAADPPPALALGASDARRLAGESGGNDPHRTRARLLEHMAEGLSLEALAAELGVPAPWYAGPRELTQPPGTLAGCVALFGIVRRGNDPDFTAGVAHSLACVFHDLARERAHAVLAALALQERAAGASSAPSTRALALAERWCGLRPSPEAVEACAAPPALVPAPADVERAALRLLATRH